MFTLLMRSQCVLVQYAAVSLAKYLPKLKADDSQKISVMCAQSIVGIFRVYFRLAEEFKDYSFIELIQISKLN